MSKPIILDSKGNPANSTEPATTLSKARTELYTIQDNAAQREVCHLSRPIEYMIEVAEANVIYLSQLIAHHPLLAVYMLDHHFHEDGTENLVLNTELFLQDFHILKALLKDCHFKIQTFIAQYPDGTVKPVSVRERAAEVMGRVKGLDPEDALKVLDPRWAEVTKKEAKTSGDLN